MKKAKWNSLPVSMQLNFQSTYMYALYSSVQYSQTCIKPTCIKRSPSIKQSVEKVLENSPLNYIKPDLYWAVVVTYSSLPERTILIVFNRIKDIYAKNFYNTDFFHTLATVR